MTTTPKPTSTYSTFRGPDHRTKVTQRKGYTALCFHIRLPPITWSRSIPTQTSWSQRRMIDRHSWNAHCLGPRHLATTTTARLHSSTTPSQLRSTISPVTDLCMGLAHFSSAGPFQVLYQIYIYLAFPTVAISALSGSPERSYLLVIDPTFRLVSGYF